MSLGSGDEDLGAEQNETGSETGATKADKHLSKLIKPVIIKKKINFKPKTDSNEIPLEWRSWTTVENGKHVQIVKISSDIKSDIELNFFGVADNGLKKLEINQAISGENFLMTKDNKILGLKASDLKSSKGLKIIFFDKGKLCLYIKAYEII